MSRNIIFAASPICANCNVILTVILSTLSTLLHISTLATHAAGLTGLLYVTTTALIAEANLFCVLLDKAYRNGRCFQLF